MTKETITAEKVFENKYQRFYKLFLPIKDGVHYTIKEVLDELRPRLKEEFKQLVPEGKDTWDLLCVSDAHTHTERLVFLAAKIEDRVGRFGSLHIHGKHTMLIHGGDCDAIHPDEVYLRNLAVKNGYKWGGLQSKEEQK